MSLAVQFLESENESDIFEQDFFVSLLEEENEQWISCINSFAFVAIQRFIAHCKNQGLDPCEMRFDEIQKFMDNCLKKELFNEMKKQN